MKRVSYFFAAVFIVSLSFVSAGFFGELFFSDNITGEVTLDSEGWTSWLDRDNPSGKGDWEHLSAFVESGGVCENPLDVQCRRISDKLDYSQTGEVVVCNNKSGFICINENQEDRGCDDYEVRFKCEEGGICSDGQIEQCGVKNGQGQKVCSEGVWSSCEIVTCNENYSDEDGDVSNGCETLDCAIDPDCEEENFPVGWTPWLDNDNPSGTGDWELLSDFVESGKVCKNPAEIECRRISDKLDASETGEKISCDYRSGFSCNKNNQEDGICDDYEVRFRCRNLDLFVSVATLKDSYSVDEEINLTDPPEEDVSDVNDPENFEGYLIEFEGASVIEEKKRLEKVAEENEMYIKEKPFYNPVKIYKQVFGIKRGDVEKKVGDYSGYLEEERESVKERISELEREGKITGNVVSEESSFGSGKDFKKTFNGIYLNVSSESIEEIKNIRGVKNVYPNYKVSIFLNESVDLIGANELWKLDEDGNDCSDSGKDCLTGKGIEIAIIDTGVDYNHEALGGGCFGEGCKVVGGFDFVNNDSDPMDDNGHGTHVASVAAGNGSLKGVAPGAKIYSFKSLNSMGDGFTSDIISAIERSIDLDGDGNIMEDEGDYVDILSMSLGGPGTPDSPLSIAVDNVVGSGVLVVTSAGNNGPKDNSISSPGNSRKAVTVGASDREDNIADFSSRGPVLWEDLEGNVKSLVKPDLVAPGVDICAARYGVSNEDKICFGDSYVVLSGTSMAAPHVAGAAALLKQKNPDWDPEEMKSFLKSTSVDLGEGFLVEGSGRLDLSKDDVGGISLVSNLENVDYIPSGEIDIFGTASGDSFERYDVSYSVEGEENWDVVCEGFEEVKGNILCENFDSGSLIEGDYALRLSVYGSGDSSRRDYGFFKIDNAEILKPLPREVYRTGSIINVTARIFNEDYSFLSAEYVSEEGEKSSLGMDFLEEDLGDRKFLLVKWNTSGLEEGVYGLRVYFDSGEENFTEEINNIHIDSTIKEGWPVLISGLHEGFSLNYEEGVSYLVDSQNNLISKLNIGKNSEVRVYGEGISEEGILIERGDSDVNVLDKKSFNVLSSIEEVSYYWPGNMEPVIDDVDGDGDKEIFVYVGGNLPKIYGFDSDGKILEGFPVEVGDLDLSGGNLGPPSIADINNDGNKEIIVNGKSSTGDLFVYSYKGVLLKEISLPVTTSPVTSIVVADLNGDGNVEIIKRYRATSESPYVGEKLIVLDNEGNVVEGWPKETYDYRVSDKKTASCNGYLKYESSPVIANLDDDGDYEIVLASMRNVFEDPENPESSWDCEGRIYAFNLEGSLVEGFPVDLDGRIFSTPVAGDVNNDGYDEIVIGTYSGGGLYVIDKKGDILEGWPKLKGESLWDFVSLFDREDDGFLEISVDKMHSVIFDYKGNELFNIGGSRNSVIIDSDENSFFLSRAYGNVVSVFEFKEFRSQINSFPNVVPGSAMVAFEDIDNDGKLELVAGVDSRRYLTDSHLFAWDLEIPYDKSNMDWPMFQRDSQHTGNYGFGKSSGETPPPEEERPQSKIVNKGDEDIEGYLRMVLQKKVDGSWSDEKVVTGKFITIPSGELIKLDIEKWYGWNLKNIYADSVGDYRVYVSYKVDKEIFDSYWEFKVE